MQLCISCGLASVDNNEGKRDGLDKATKAKERRCEVGWWWDGVECAHAPKPVCDDIEVS